ncbi:MAG: hypothetical protein AAGD92_06570 [Pseudomonadota bacterium]
MSDNEHTQPSELDLQAYLDDELPPAERAKIIEWLIEHPTEGQKLFEMQLREDLLRTAVWQSVNGVDLNEELVKTIRPNAEKTKSAQNMSVIFVCGIIAGVIAATVIFLTF